MDTCQNCNQPIVIDSWDDQWEWTHADGTTECVTTRDTTWNPARDYATA